MDHQEQMDRIDRLFADILKPHDQMTEKQRRILETSLEMFAEKGYNGVSTSEIAAKADVAEATIFKHFKTKKRLFISIVAPVIARLATPAIKRMLEKVVDSDQSLDQFLRALFLDRVQLLNDNLPLAKVIVREAQYHPELWQAINDHLVNKVYVIIEQVLEAKQASGQIRRDIPSYAIVRAAVSTVLGYVVFKNVFPGVMQRQDDEQEIDLLVDILVNGIRKQ